MDIQLISLILGCIGTIGTITGSVLTFVRSRVRISVDVVSWLQSDDCLFIYALITNNSRLPISVSSISAIMNGVDVPCSLEPFVVTYRKLPGILGKEQFEPVRSLPFPLNLGPLSGVSGYLYFRNPQPSSQPVSTHLSLSVHTNRKDRVSIECELLEDQFLRTRYFLQ